MNRILSYSLDFVNFHCFTALDCYDSKLEVPNQYDTAPESFENLSPPWNIPNRLKPNWAKYF